MVVSAKRKYPVGIQSFEKIRKEGYVYVDKTELVYKMITEGFPYFLSRPRRFGKSLLVDTLAMVFEGRRELFEEMTLDDGTVQPRLFIADTDWKWEHYPVLRFDFSKSNLSSLEKLDEFVNFTLSGFEEQYGVPPSKDSSSIRMTKIIHAAERQTGKKVVVLVDEYDNMLLHNLGDAAMQTAIRERFQDLFMPLKGEDSHLQFIFITGISKFSQMGIFSRINQLNNISMLSAYDTLCGISEEELTTTLRPDIELLAGQQGKDYDTMLAELKTNYDGYHFGMGKNDMYNPFSLFKAFANADVSDYWFESGTTSALIDMLSKMPPVDLSSIEHVRCPSSAFDLPFDSYDMPLPILYQSGYLTIKDYQPDRKMFVLGMPNGEVRRGFADCLFRIITNIRPDDRNRMVFLNAYYDFRDSGDLQAFIEALQTFYAGVPYHLAQGNENEHYYHALLYTLLASYGADLVCEEPSAKGRADLTLKMPKGIYVIELKYDDTAEAALRQIDERGYARKYALDGRPVIKVGLAFSQKERNITEWKSEEA